MLASVRSSSPPQPTSKLLGLRTALAQTEAALDNDDLSLLLDPIRRIRRLLSVKGDGILQDVLDGNLVPLLLRFLGLAGHADMQAEALWALINISAGASQVLTQGATQATPQYETLLKPPSTPTHQNAHMIVRFGAARSLLNVLAGGDASKWSSPPEVPKLAMWVLGNIAGDGAAARDPLIAAGVVPVLTRAIETCGHTPTLRVATWALSNLCDGQPRPMLQVDSMIPVLAAALRCLDTEVLCHVCWVLSHLCDGPGAHIQAVVAANVCRHLVGLLTHPSWRVIKPALRTVGNIVCAEADVDYTHHIVLLGAVPCLRVLIEHPCKDIQKEACWTLSNIAAGSVDQIQAVLDSGAVPSIINLASNHATDPIVMAEARWVLLNATSCGSDAQVCVGAHTHTHAPRCPHSHDPFW